MMRSRRSHNLPPRQRKLRTNSDEAMQKLEKLIESLTTSGRTKLDEHELKSLKKICKRGDRYVEHAFGELWDQLSKDHSEIRLSAFQIADVLFQRSHRFRDLVLTQFEEFIQLVTGLFSTMELSSEISSRHKEEVHILDGLRSALKHAMYDVIAAVNVGTSLPPPKPAAKLLYQTAVKSIHEWNTKYRTSYKKLALGYGYLKTVKKVDFSSVEPRTQAEQQQTEARRRRLEDYRRQRLDRLVKEIDDTLPEMQNCVTELRNCFDLLLPNQTFIPDWGEILASNMSENTETENVASRGKGVGKKSVNAGENTEPELNECSDAIKATSQSTAVTNNSDEHSDKIMMNDSQEEGNISMVSVEVEQKVSTRESMETVSRKIEEEHEKDERKSSFSEQDSEGLESTQCENSNSAPGGTETNQETGQDSPEEDVHVEPKPSTSGYVSKMEQDVFDSDETDSDFEEVPCKEMDLLRTHGFVDRNFQLQIDILPTIKETDDNREIIKNMNDRDKLVASQYMPLIIGWLENLSKLGAEAAILKKTIDMKQTLADVRQKYQQLSSRIKFGPSPPLSVAIEQSLRSDESSFGVMKTEHVAAHSGGKAGCHSNEPSAADVISPLSDGGRKSKLLKVAPFVPYDRDLKYWGREDELKPTLYRGQSLHRFLSAAEQEEFVPPGATTSERTMTFIGQIPANDRACRAPLANGKLCPRQDRMKCPFHGKIIDRDACGQPVHAVDKPLFNWGEQGDRQSWQDVELMEEIEAAKDVDLGSAKVKQKEGKDRKRKHPGLTDLNQAKNTTKKRIERKIFNKASIKRVNSALEKMDVKRTENKFGSQFIHTFGK